MQEKPIIILGLSGSGTGLAASILGDIKGSALITEHDPRRREAAISVRDSDLWAKYFRFRRKFGFLGEETSEPFPSKTGEARLAEEYRRLADGRRLIIKNPQNLVRLDVLERVVPSSIYVWVARDPLSILDSVSARLRKS